jgi:hypothetical protein
MEPIAEVLEVLADPVLHHVRAVPHLSMSLIFCESSLPM